MSRCPKIRYPDHIAAKIAIASTQRSPGSQREEQRAYRCGRCHGWHLTSRPKRTTNESKETK